MLSENEWVQPTLDKKGFMFKKLTEASKAFVAYAENAVKPVLDMGCAYGNATLPVLKKKKPVIACDLDPRHLDLLVEKVPPGLRKYLTVRPGAFPGDFDFPAKSLSAVHISHLLHFLRGDQIQEGIRKAYHWLDSGGKFFVNVGTPYQQALGFIDEYRRREQEGRDWPGEMNAQDMELFWWPEVREKIPPEAFPSFMNLLTEKELRRVLESVGFHVEELYYVNPDLPPELVPFIGGDGKGWMSAIASKPQ